MTQAASARRALLNVAAVIVSGATLALGVFAASSFAPGTAIAQQDDADAAGDEVTEPATDRRRDSLFDRPGGRREHRRRPQPAEPPTDEAAAKEADGPPAVDRRGRHRLPARPKRDIPPYEQILISDRWRLIEALGVHERWWDPYNQNTLKADRPIFGTQDVFFNLLVISDTTVEPRRLPTPVGVQTNRRANSLDIFGDGEQLGVVSNLIVGVVLTKGDTVFRPPDYEFRFTGVGNVNYQNVDTFGALYIDPTRGHTRTDWHFGVQELFIDKHLANKSDRYDFDSLRVGIQPFTSDFRGFLFNDEPLGARLFGNFANNRLQYNLAYFRRIEKDTNSGLNEIEHLRNDDVFVANVYYQDFPVLGFQLQASAIYNRNREGSKGGRHFNSNGFLERPAPVGDARPHDYDVGYLGLSGDGHIDRLNLTFSSYLAVGKDDHNPIAARPQDILAYFAAVEASYDFDWYRLKAFGAYSSGDDDPFDDRAGGFDAILENPQFAGADTSFWQRQSIPLIFGGGVVLSGRNAMIPSLRTSRNEGQSNFVNPGLGLVGVGADFDIWPEMRFELNASWLVFDDTSSLRLLRNQAEIGNEIGWDLSAAITYRPFFSQNIVVRLAGAVLLPGDGLRDLFDTRNGQSPMYSVLANLVLTY
ncbi:MAG: hypothetical protein AAEJ52_20745 [Myxococcota bacterium]